MRPPFSLLVVHGDGSRVVRFRLPRCIAYGALALSSAFVTAAVCLSDRYVRLQHDSGQLEALRRGAGDRTDLAAALQHDLAAIRSAVDGWRAVHARMWAALGPEGDAHGAGSGVGGGTPDDDADANLTPWEQLDLLQASVAEEGPRLRELEQAIEHTGQLVDALPLRWPLHGPVNSEFGPRASPWTGRLERHPGIDIGSWTGTPVESPAPATVIATGRGVEYGNYVTLAHGNGVTSRYGHLQKIDVKVGDRVERGQVIGRVGSTGLSTGPHLHYEVLVEGKQVNPRKFLWER